MASSTSTLPYIQQSQSLKEVTANALHAAASPAMLFGRNQSTSSGLTWGYLEGNLLNAGVVTFIAAGTLTLTASATNYIEATTSGVVSANTTGFTSGSIPLYTAVTDAANVTSYTDQRAVQFAIRP